MESSKKEQKRFEELHKKRVLLYGSGITAKNLLRSEPDFEIVGVLDHFQFEGHLLNIPILTWDDVTRDTADALIIAASRKYIKTIYERIQYLCFSLALPIYSINGRNLSREYSLNYFDNRNAAYFKKNDAELKHLIDQYDAVSFDLFDTLVMRKTLYPVDIFDLVEDRIKEKGVIIPHFKKKRRTAEIQSNGGKIEQIYEHLRENTGITEEESAIILQEELQCEKQCLIPRTVMVALMDYAVNAGKEVNIISDMYLSSAFLHEILDELGISGYHKIYVSCEYGVGKGNGLFEKYRQDVGNLKCLHIGDNWDADIVSPGKSGIDSYEVKSACEMLKISNLRKMLICANGVNNNCVLGLLLSEIFNNPFALYHTNGIFSIRSLETFSRLFIAPVVLIYMQNLLQLLESEKYAAILFSSRDGYLFRKIYDLFFQEKYKVPSVYFMASRKLCLSATVENEQDLLNFAHYFPEKKIAKEFLERFIGKEKMKGSDCESYDSTETCFLSFSEQMKQASSALRSHYYRYISRMDLRTDQKYLLCDLCSSGTVHEALNKLFSCELDGFYLCRMISFKSQNLKASYIYHANTWNNIAEKDDLLELILTSFDPSVYAVDQNGEPVYSAETRNQQDLDGIRKMQEAILIFMQQYLEMRNITDLISKELPDIALGLSESVIYEGEAEYLLKQKNVDDMSQGRISIINEFSSEEKV